ncbi:hypothetical protein WICMUC_000564 [Wickerhamomyces mucosus]|uniref:Major facilitator superfamily (MFS) profile domain-containing protein n=1 Tax=Wickerhamomyces mucosus TaxID=1378264 RepID=A0A9P8PXC7_9ASCO|nr:hypothetical protein WICMUC_000564 [Wickerhamomyces mucosus]
MSQSPLLEPQDNNNTLTDPTLGSSGLIVRQIGQELQHDEPIQYGSINQDIEHQHLNIDPQQELVKLEIDEIDPFTIKIIISSLLLGSFLSALDTTIVTTLLTTIASDINALSKMQWIATSYFLSCSAFQPLYGKLSDIFGRKPLLIFSNLSFAIGCLLCGIANDLLTISIGRFITGIGAGGLTMVGTVTISDIIPLRKRGVYQGLGNIAFGLGAASGGLLGSIFEKLFNWQAAFLFQVPIALISAIITWRNLNLPKGSPGLGIKGSKFDKLKQVDFLGSFLLVTSLLSFMILVSFIGKSIEINSILFWILIILTIIPLLTFNYVELYIASTPIIPVRLLLQRTVLSSSLINWFMSMAVFTYMFYLPVFWSSVLRLTPTEIGIRTISNFVGVSFGSFFAGIYMKRTGKYLWLSILTGFTTVLGALAIYSNTKDSPLWFQYIELFIPGASYAALLTTTLLALIAAVPHDQQASTTSIQYAFRATGSTIGVSAASFIFQYYLSKSLNDKLFKIPSNFNKDEIYQIINKSLESSEYTWEAPKIFRDAIIDSYDFSTHKALFFALICAIIAWGFSLFMKEHHLHSSINRK